MRQILARVAAIGTAVLILGLALLFGWRQQQRMDSLAAETDPGAWAALYSLHYASYMRSARQDAGEPRDKLAAKPFRRRAWAGYPFELEHNEARAHYYSLVDQRESRRTREREQPAGCVDCHAAEAPFLIDEYGWEGLHAMRYDEVADRLAHGSSCLDCHDPADMSLRVSRPSFITAMRARGVDLAQATRQDMRTYVCAQCHVEYYFQPPGNELRLPWTGGLRLEDLERYFAEAGFSDWRHPESGAGMVKIQHPDFELYSSGIHAAEGVACADCHMPAVEKEGARISDHWMRSPMDRVESACLVCHEGEPGRLVRRVAEIQRSTSQQLANVETAIGDLIDGIVAARAAGASDAQLQEARRAHRRAQLRWDFVDSENSTGFHAFHEATRILSDAVEIARDGERGLRGRPGN